MLIQDKQTKKDEQNDGPDANRATKIAQMVSPDDFFAISASGVRVRIPRELFDALQEFLVTKKNAGSITLQFRAGEITCVEALAKKTYRNK